MPIALPSIAKYGLNCALVLGAKVLLTKGLEQGMHALAAYSIVHVFTVFFSYYLHAKNTFRAPLSWGRFFIFLKTVLIFKVFDYLIFSLVFVAWNIQSEWAISIATLAVFLLRFTAIKKVMVSPVKSNEEATVESAAESAAESKEQPTHGRL